MGSQEGQEKGVASLPSKSELEEKRENEKEQAFTTIPPVPYMPPLPFPQRFTKAKINSQF